MLSIKFVEAMHNEIILPTVSKLYNIKSLSLPNTCVTEAYKLFPPLKYELNTFPNSFCSIADRSQAIRWSIRQLKEVDKLCTVSNTSTPLFLPQNFKIFAHDRPNMYI